MRRQAEVATLGSTAARSRLLAAALLILLAAFPSGTLAQPEGACTVSVLNQTAHLQEDGSWDVPNVPANMGPVRARITCVRNGAVVSGASPFFEIISGRMSAIPTFSLGAAAPRPARLTLSAPAALLASAGETLQLTTSATLADGTSADVTAANAGTVYTSSNRAIASVDGEGRVTAQASGRALIGALHEAIAATFEVEVRTSGDSDGDGLPDDWEAANGLDPRDELDALEDPDRDGLSTLEEFRLGLQPFDPDTDDDGIADGREVEPLGTNPLLGDTDGDGLWDGLEIETGSDPLDPASFDLQGALAGIEAAPAVLSLVFNTVYAEASRQLSVVGRLRDGRSIDLTQARYAASFTSSDLQVASFGPERGRVYAGRDGEAAVTVAAGGVSAAITVRVAVFSPRPLSFVQVPGFANSLDVEGSHAYVAAGAAGVQVIDVSDLLAPRVVAAADTPGNANDLRLAGGFAFVADGDEGLAVVDVRNPAAPVRVAQLGGLTGANDLALAGSLAYVVGPYGLAVVDVTDPVHPVRLGSTPLPGTPRGVDVSGSYALVAADEAGVLVVDVSDPAAPSLAGRTATRPDGSSHAADLVVRGSHAYVADGAYAVLGGLRVIDFSVPSNPVVVGTSSDEFGLTSLALDGELVFSSDYYYANAVPVFNSQPASPVFREAIDFFLERSDRGHGVVAREGVVFLVGTACCYGSDNNGVTANSALFIGRYATQDSADDTTPPRTEIEVPGEGAAVGERAELALAARAFDDGVVEAVEYFIGGASLGMAYRPSFNARYTVPDGAGPELVVGARARDTAGNLGAVVERRVRVIPNARPVARLLAPVAGQRAPEGRTLILAAGASDDQAVRSVRFFVDGSPVATLVTPPYRFEVTVPAGRASLEVTALAFDDAGPSEVAGPVRVTIDPDLPPTARILSPPDGFEAQEGANVEVLAGAADDIGLLGLTLTVDDLLLGTVTTPPFRFLVPLPEAGTMVRLRAEAEDTKHQTSRSPEITLVATSIPRAALHGRTVDPSGAPIAGARIEAVGRNARTTSGPDGTFRLADLEVAGGAIGLQAIGYVGGGLTLYRGSLPQIVELSPGAVLEVGDLVLSPLDAGRTSVAGTIVDPEGAGVSGAQVKVYSAYSLAVVASDAEGRFRVDDVPVGPRGLEVAATGPAPEGLTGRGRISVSPVPGGVTEVGDLVLWTWDPTAGEPFTSATGRVVVAGAPLTGVKVFLSTQLDLFEATTGADGRFSFPEFETVDNDTVYAFAAATVNGSRVAGQTIPFWPVPGGITDLGDLELRVDEGPIKRTRRPAGGNRRPR